MRAVSCLLVKALSALTGLHTSLGNAYDDVQWLEEA